MKKKGPEKKSNGTSGGRSKERKQKKGNGKARDAAKYSCKVCSKEALKAQPDPSLILACVAACSKGCKNTVACAKQINGDGGFATRRKTICMDSNKNCAVLKHASSDNLKEYVLETMGAYEINGSIQNNPSLSGDMIKPFHGLTGKVKKCCVYGRDGLDG